MPMIDVYAARGVIENRKGLAQELTQAVMRWEKVPAIPFFTDNTAAFVHELETDSLSTAGGGTDHVRVTVTTNADALNREQQLGLVKEISELVAKASGDPSLAGRTWVALTEAVPGGWGGPWGLGHRRSRLHQRRDRPARARAPRQGLTSSELTSAGHRARLRRGTQPGITRSHRGLRG
ncbi:hypothetical protein ACFWOX_18330 [Streptomyces sp. NPDC058467]|uniref:hypothetical protein n=2 Tax=unclassified Streptomyces TaxID=2593676 RepID=UPI00364E660F